MIDDSKIDDSIIKTDFLKLYKQHGAEGKNGDQNFKFHFGGNPIFWKRKQIRIISKLM